MHIIHIDWLQIFGKGIINLPDYCKAERREYGSKVFENIDTIFIQNLEYCTILSAPRSSILHPDTVIIKLENSQLYKPNFIQFFIDFLNDCNIREMNITRLDLCSDFNYFYNNLQPSKFISGFLTNKYLKTKKSGYYIRGNQQQEHIIDTFKVGSPASNLSAYLYNKTQEMKDRTWKPWISDSWIINELDITKPVYRLEVSIKNMKIVTTDKEKKEFKTIGLHDLLDFEYVKELYYRGIKTGFRFKHNDGTANKSRMEDVILFKQIEASEPITFDNDKLTNSRHTKGVINFLEKLNNEIRELRQEDRTKFSYTAESIAEMTDLQIWYNDRYKNNNEETNNELT